MRSEELADFTEDLIRLSRTRILGTGRAQYEHGETQRFEELPLGSLLDELMDEVVDVVNYLGMVRLRILEHYPTESATEPSRRG